MAISNNPLDPTGRSILAQVAFKGAIELATAGKITEGEVIVYTKAFTEELVTYVAEQKEEFFASLPAKAEGGGADGLRDQLGATDTDEASYDNGAVIVLGKQHGPLPSWLAPQMAAAGATKVFDERERKKGNQPWFKTPKDADEYGEPADKAFWPPRK